MSIPNIYTEIEYIENTAGQYINTGYSGNDSSRYVMEFEVTSTQSTEWPTPLGGRPNANNTVNAQMVHLSSNPRNYDGATIGWGGVITVFSGYGITGLINKRVMMDLKTDQIIFTVDNVPAVFTYTGGNVTASTPIGLFALLINGSPANYSYITGMKLYSLRVYENDVMVREYIPVIRDSDNKPGMYETINGVFYTNSGPGDFTPGNPVWVDSFTVIYNSNGGSGTMSDQVIKTDTPTPLELNTFVRSGYIFSGWSTSPNGAVMYADGETVINLAPTDESITLYANWKTGFNIDIQVNFSEPERLDKVIDSVYSLWGTLKSETSIINPVILIYADLSTISGCNYMTIPSFGRSYFITDMRSIRYGLVEITGRVDVLTTYKDGIRANRGIIRRQETEWNLNLNDGSFRIYQDQLIQTKVFPSGFNSMEFVLAVAGTAQQSS